MKIIKRILIGILILITLIVLTIVVFYVLDTSRASYLKTKNMEAPLSNEYLIKNVNVIPMTKDTVLANKMVHIKAGKIYNVDDTIEGQGLEIIDGQGKFLSPGLIDMHVHVWDRFELGLYLANGVTTVRNLWGVPLHLRIKNELADDELIGPMFYTSSPKLTGPDDLGDDKVQIQSVEQARALIQDYDKRGYDFIKTYAGITEPLFEAIVEEATSLDLDIVSHPSFQMTYSKNFIDQVATIEHAEDIVQQPLNYQLDSVKLDSVVALMATSKVNFSPTLSGFYNIYRMLTEDDLLQKKSIGYINPLFKSVDTEVQVARWQGEKSRDPEVVERILTQHKFHLYIIKKLHEAGVNIVCSTDAGIAIGAPGYSIHQEMQHYSDAGLTNYEVIKTATVNPTRVHKEFEDMGTIEKSKWANLILSDENPLENLNTLKEPHWVMIKGRLLDGKTLDTFKNKAFDRNNLTSTALYWIENLWIER
ncbi:amidohydrolase family protein [Lutimonas halocynthiae]|uniref:amidohydrolase family protein n=1 Tax=Lutimonas halocynthiae TaxID=1446477 RepID=UPI0025B4A837|nr:amidohydrolase family protein [Lutimonas halocynthiae]MDN3641141.1 amidohydrolase family protein [Lutimonas halocynthiae]